MEATPTDDNVRQKLDSGAILVHGSEELPLDCCENNEAPPHLHHHSPSQLRSPRSAERRRGRSRSLVSETTTTTTMTTKHLLHSDDNNVEDVFHENDNAEEDDSTIRDDNANSKVTRSPFPERSATLPRRRRRRTYSGCVPGAPLPPHRVTPDGTAIYYWCELPQQPGSQGKCSPEQSHPPTAPLCG